ncbi:hypothetical protein [Gracilimonas sp.]|uniref:capsular polysaccharide export protein, LipB/KpsS family n=1 Tax=Gracilimonas sp. TaxID=1974203 RepID=UPI003D0C4955
MKKKIIGFAVNNHKKELLKKLEKTGEFEVHYFCLKHLDYLDLKNEWIDESKLYSYPLLRKNYSDIKEIPQLAEKIIENEEKYGIRPANRLISYNYQRSMLPDFKEKDLYQTILFEQETLSKLIEEIDPDAVLGELSRSYYIIAYDICKHLKVQYFNPLEIRASYYGEPLYALYNDEGKKLRFNSLFKEFQSNKATPSEKASNFAEEFESRIFNKAKFNSKKLRNFESGFNKFIKKTGQRLKRLKAYKDSFNLDRKYFAEKLTFKNQFYSVFKTFVIDEIKTPIVYRYKSKFYTSKLDLDKMKYVYFPLHFYPELVSSVWSNKFINYHDQELHLIQSIAKNLPTGYKLLVKEHMPMVNNRKTSIYKKINSLYNTVLLSPAFDNFKLIEKSDCVITICSTTGFEAFLKDKPVLTYHGAFYQDIPSIKKIDMNQELHDQILNAINSFKIDEKAKLDALCAFYDSSCTFEYDSDSVNEFDVSYNDKSVGKISEYLKSFLSD